MEEAISAVQDLNGRGINATLDHLGENTATPQDARQAADEILGMFDRIQQAGVIANISLKLSQIGLLVDPALCRENLIRVLEVASSCQSFVRIDMEDSALTTQTLDTFRAARQSGFNNVGVVIQSYLYRSEADVRGLIALDSPIRLCKGAYKEPAAVAYPRKADVDANYDRIARMLLDYARTAREEVVSRSQHSGGRVPPVPGFATHDPKRIAIIKAYADKFQITPDRFEFQMLYGIRRDLQESLKAEGYAVRVYVPFGVRWYPYFMRRLAERPENIWFFLTNYFRS